MSATQEMPGVTGRDFVNHILAFEQPAQTGSRLLDAIDRLPLDGHDAKGAVFIASEGLSRISSNDPYRPALQSVTDFARDDGRYTKSTMRGILFICREAVGKLAEPAF